MPQMEFFEKGAKDFQSHKSKYDKPLTIIPKP